MRERYRVWAEIDLEAVIHNYQTIRASLKPGTKIMAVLKANAYGHGAVEIAKTLAVAGIDAIGVGDSQEALELREAGITLPILILGAIIPGEIEDVISHDVQANVHSLELAEEMNRVAARLNTVAEVQLMIDTGMGRLGLDNYSAVSLLRQIRRFTNLKLKGICTHLSSPAEESSAFTTRQLERFNTIAELARSICGHDQIDVHAASHTALLKYPDAHFDMVRPGLAFYGVSLSPNNETSKKLKRVMSVKTQILFLKDVPEGTPISYNRQWYASAPTKIATLPIGYNDGIPVALTNRSEVLVRGRRCPIVGRISMDYVMVDVGHVPEVQRGDVVTVIGKDGDEEIRLEDIAGKLGTVPYAVSCGLGRRVRRVYHNQGVSSSRLRRRRAA